MNVYIYQAALYCEKCGKSIRANLAQAAIGNDLDMPTSETDESTYDSDRYPKGPYADGGGEADCPQHCDSCGVFLENPLTSDGYAYVRIELAVGIAGRRDTLETWRTFYGITDGGEENDNA